jgi:hypothetical protein
VADARARYGDDGGRRVLELEARLQAQYDQVSERHRPVLWPHLPVRL